MQESFERIK